MAYETIDIIFRAQCKTKTWVPWAIIIKTFKMTTAEHALNEAQAHLSVGPYVTTQPACLGNWSCWV